MYFNNISQLALFLKFIPMSPYLDIVHYILMCCSVKDDTMNKSKYENFSKRQPFSSWMASMIMCFSSSILCNIILGNALVTPIKTTTPLLYATIIWYVINYMPFNFIHRILSFKLMKMVLYIAKELHRMRNILIGISVAFSQYPDAWLIALLIGTLKGCGSCIFVNVQRFVRGIIVAHQNEFLQPTFTSKSSALLCGLLLLQKYEWIKIDSNVLFVVLFSISLYLRIFIILFDVVDPIRPIEAIFGFFAFNGWQLIGNNAHENNKPRKDKED
ncbi:hypothetical protein A3Q56_05771 [Intoshia linei]|uniref:Uncharacterized protein n=1 Tax=Intoshia linei TaxID=1819745 RepID=A0A177AWY1_9BILA|nr:hypothetical protein A3Q56_05771 [Intoshia linei]